MVRMMAADIHSSSVLWEGGQNGPQGCYPLSCTPMGGVSVRSRNYKLSCDLILLSGSRGLFMTRDHLLSERFICCINCFLCLEHGFSHVEA